jgi:hypothetical protein
MNIHPGVVEHRVDVLRDGQLLELRKRSVVIASQRSSVQMPYRSDCPEKPRTLLERVHSQQYSKTYLAVAMVVLSGKVCSGVGLFGTFLDSLAPQQFLPESYCGLAGVKAASGASWKEHGPDLGQGMVLACGL